MGWDGVMWNDGLSRNGMQFNELRWNVIKGFSELEWRWTAALNNDKINFKIYSSSHISVIVFINFITKCDLPHP